MQISHVNQIMENIHTGRLYMHNIPDEDIVITFVINDLLHMQEDPDLSVISSVELNSLLVNVCVN